eukprot:5194792-Pleurochrysis_carterae.AAC.6
MKRALSSVVNGRGGLFGSMAVDATGAAVVAPERVPPAGPNSPPSAGVNCAGAKCGLIGEGDSNV